MKISKYLPEIFCLLLLILIVVGVMYLPIPKNQTFVHSSISNSKKNTLVMETKCKDIFERVYGVEFKKIRPSFLKNPATNKNLELDGYNDKLRIAFEYNGSQHYFYNPHFHKDKKAFEDQLKKDQLKKELCQKNNIHLVVIPYDLRENELENFIIQNLPSRTNLDQSNH